MNLLCRICIVAAGVVRRHGRKLAGNFVEGSLKMWTSTHKPAKGEHFDYHGNFNAELFEHWFEEVCETLSESFGPTIIHMDGAKYHKRVLNPSPTASWDKETIQEWLEDEGAIALFLFDKH